MKLERKEKSPLTAAAATFGLRGQTACWPWHHTARAGAAAVGILGGGIGAPWRSAIVAARLAEAGVGCVSVA